MTNQTKHSRLFCTRRTAISGMAASAIFPISANLGQATPLNQMHKDVAQHVIRVAKGKPTKLRLLLPSGSGGNLKPIVAAFEEMTGVKVRMQETPVDEINTELMLAALSGSKDFDVALPATFGLPDLVSSNAILSLTDFTQRYEPPGFRDDILFGVGDSFDGETYGFQTDGDAYVMFYNKAMLEDTDEKARYADTFGQALSKPQTWQELDRQMGYFNRPDQGQWGGLLFRTPGYLAWEWWVRFHAKGVWPFSKDMEPQITSDEGVSALEEMIHATENLHPDVSQLGLFENWTRFSQGDVYCNIGWGGSQKYLNGPASKMRNNMLYGPTPGGIVDGNLLITPYFNWGWDYVVAKNSTSPELSYLFALFASTPKMTTLAVGQNDGFFDPFRPEHYDDIDIQSAYTQDFLEVHRASLEGAIPDLYLKDQGEYFRVLSDWLNRALAKEVSPKKALRRVAQEWQLITNGSGRRIQIERWARLRDKYPNQIQKSLRDIF